MVFSSASLSLLDFPLDISAAMEKAFARDESCGFGDDVYSMSVEKSRTQIIPLLLQKDKKTTTTTQKSSRDDTGRLWAPTGKKKKKKKFKVNVRSLFQISGLCAHTFISRLNLCGSARHCWTEGLVGLMAEEGAGRTLWGSVCQMWGCSLGGFGPVCPPLIAPECAPIPASGSTSYSHCPAEDLIPSSQLNNLSLSQLFLSLPPLFRHKNT